MFFRSLHSRLFTEVGDRCCAKRCLSLINTPFLIVRHGFETAKIKDQPTPFLLKFCANNNCYHNTKDYSNRTINPLPQDNNNNNNNNNNNTTILVPSDLSSEEETIRKLYPSMNLHFDS